MSDGCPSKRRKVTESCPILSLWLARKSALKRTCLYWTRGCRPDAEDLLGDALVRALEAQSSAREIIRPIAWLNSIIANLGRDRWRRGKQEVAFEPYTDSSRELIFEQSHCDDALDARRRLLQFLKSDLSSAQRHVLLQRCVGESYRDIARDLQVSESMARKLAQQARATVKASGVEIET
jgi:RNA polymerase sigma factor (sigma-70 family)